MKKNIFLILTSVVFIFIPNIALAEELSESQILKMQGETFGISDFIKETEKYSKDVFPNIDIQNMLNSAVEGKVDNKGFLKRILNLFGNDIISTLKTFISILVVILIHSILKAFADDLNNSEVSKIIYYVQYILIVTIIMNNFSEIFNSISDTINNLTGFAHILVPLLVTLTVSSFISSFTYPVLTYIFK